MVTTDQRTAALVWVRFPTVPSDPSVRVGLDHECLEPHHSESVTKPLSRHASVPPSTLRALRYPSDFKNSSPDSDAFPR
jgi:hypothetical protein